MFTATKKQRGKTVWFSFAVSQRRVTCYYFYVWDDDFGPAFVKVCAYFPYPMKIWVNGHEWAKRQAAKAGIGFTELSNGFASCTDPAALQAICDRLGPGVIRVFAERWWSMLPLPLTEHDRAAGYWWELSMRQVETSRTLVFDAPRHARGFFEALVADNLDIGRPELIELIFKRGQRRGAKARGEYKTRIVTYGTEVNVNAFYRHSRIKQYLKDGRALRIETVINDPDDLGCLRRLCHLDELQARARAINTTLLDTERVGQGCVLASPAFERIAQPTLTEDGRRAPALRFGDPRVQGPGRRPVHQRARRHRHHQQEPARLDDRTARRCRPTPGTRPATTWPGYASTGSSPASRAKTATGSPATACGSRSSTPNCTTGCYARCSPPTSHPPRHHCERHCTPSTFTSQKPSTRLACCRTQPENSRQLSTTSQRPSDQKFLRSWRT